MPKLRLKWSGWRRSRLRVQRRKRRQAANNALQGYLEKLRSFRVLDPACGSGNFLYLALQALKDIEHRANIEAEALGLHVAKPAGWSRGGFRN